MVDVVDDPRVLVFRLILVLVLSEFLPLGVPADAVGCLPAPLSLRSSAKSRRRLPSSPPNATATAKAAPWKWDAGQKRTLKGQGAFWRGSIDELRKGEGQAPASGERTTGALKDGGRSAPARSRKTSLAGALRRCSIEVMRPEEKNKPGSAPWVR